MELEDLDHILAVVAQVLPHVLDHHVKLEHLARGAADAGRRDRRQALLQVHIGRKDVEGKRDHAAGVEDKEGAAADKDKEGKVEGADAGAAEEAGAKDGAETPGAGKDGAAPGRKAVLKTRADLREAERYERDQLDTRFREM